MIIWNIPIKFTAKEKKTINVKPKKRTQKI